MGNHFKAIDTVLLKIASRCNINCQYCYVYNSPDQQWRRQPTRMSEGTIDSVVNRLSELRRAQHKELAIVLHGGEPLLLGRPRLERLLTGLRLELGPSPTLALQTNGILLDDYLMDLFADTRTRLSVSLDGPRHINDKFRVDHAGHSTFAATVSSIERLIDHPRTTDFFYGVLAVVNPKFEPANVYSFFKSLNVPSIDFIYRDGNHSRLPYGKNSFESVEYGKWMAKLWDLYIQDNDPIPIECLDNLVRCLCGKVATKEGCGDSNFGILIVDTDGSISKNDTLKNSYDGADRFGNVWSVQNHSFQNVTSSKEYQEYVASQTPTNPNCKKCSILDTCGGGMILHRWSDENEYNNPSIYCNDQLYLIHHILGTLNSLVA